MRRSLTGVLAAAIVLSGWQAGLNAATRTHAQAGAPAPALRPQDTGGGLVRSGTLINQSQQPTFTVDVLGSYDIFLAGRAYPYSVRGPHGNDLAGPNTPQELRVAVGAGSTVTILTRLGTAHAANVPRAKSADGYTQTVILAGPDEPNASKVGLSSLIAPIDGLVGVFTGSQPAVGPRPRTLNFASAKAREALTVKPALYQTFYIGQGTAGKGQRKRFIVPNGATRLYLGSFAYLGGNHAGNGAIIASITGTTNIYAQYQPIPTFTNTPVPPTATLTPFPTETQFPTDTVTATLPPTNTPAPTNTATATATLTATNTATATPTLTPTATATNTATVTQTATIVPSPTQFTFPTH